MESSESKYINEFVAGIFFGGVVVEKNVRPNKRS